MHSNNSTTVINNTLKKTNDTSSHISIISKSKIFPFNMIQLITACCICDSFFTVLFVHGLRLPTYGGKPAWEASVISKEPRASWALRPTVTHSSTYCPTYRQSGTDSKVKAKMLTSPWMLNTLSKVDRTPGVTVRAEANVAYLVPRAKRVTQTSVYTQVES